MTSVKTLQCLWWKLWRKWCQRRRAEKAYLR